MLCKINLRDKKKNISKLYGTHVKLIFLNVTVDKTVGRARISRQTVSHDYTKCIMRKLKKTNENNNCDNSV